MKTIEFNRLALSIGVVTIAALAKDKTPSGTIQKVELLGHAGALEFTQDSEGLKVKMPADKPGDYAVALRITGSGLMSNPSKYTVGNRP